MTTVSLSGPFHLRMPANPQQVLSQSLVAPPANCQISLLSPSNWHPLPQAPLLPQITLSQTLSPKLVQPLAQPGLLPALFLLLPTPTFAAVWFPPLAAL
jgi:hypothetical protein